MIASDALPLLEKEAKKRKQESGKVHGKGQIGVGKNAHISNERHRARDDAAKMFGVSPRHVEFAKVIKRKKHVFKMNPRMVGISPDS